MSSQSSISSVSLEILEESFRIGDSDLKREGSGGKRKQAPRQEESRVDSSQVDAVCRPQKESAGDAGVEESATVGLPNLCLALVMCALQTGLCGDRGWYSRDL